MLQFDAARHEYRIDGRVVPSVTQVLSILQDFGAVSAVVLERAREFGQHVADAIDLDNRGVLDWDALDQALRPPVLAWRDMLEKTGSVVISSEEPLGDRHLGYAGKPDAILEAKGRRTLVDVKSGLVPRTVGAQTAAYERLWKIKYPARRIHGRAYFQLRDGDYRLRRLTDPADWSLFQSCLNVHRWKAAA